eukprot:TRINITY_DN2610_c0_g1_i15.p1 TRINITY_DN2610_c0_g1~~TRINITY_DN2610_c0_g1_i15.p1  ORF type:complete len:682 (+),score=115.33 TRINITY_DN2610_c0_g1_i15:89-2134(+)
MSTATFSGGIFKYYVPKQTSGNEIHQSNHQGHDKSPRSGNRILLKVTKFLVETLQRCDPSFNFDSLNNPKRSLTNPPQPCHNNGYDNEMFDYILLLNDVIYSPEDDEYIIQEFLGKGTFGQVVKCQKKGTNQHYAIKVIKNKPAYTKQAIHEIKLLRLLNKVEEKISQRRIVQLTDYFYFRNHLFLVFEMLGCSLFDLLKGTQFKGMALSYIRKIMRQIIEANILAEKLRIIHCDLKPENILFNGEYSDDVKVIDYGSAVFVNHAPYTYIQSRFYRAPEVLLGMKYSSSIDSWSLGCIAAELFLGLPIFPGDNEYDQIRRIVNMIGVPETSLLDQARNRDKFFKLVDTEYVLKDHLEYGREFNIEITPPKRYFEVDTLKDLVNYIPNSKYRQSNLPLERELFPLFLDFLEKLLVIDPTARWSSSRAINHPFVANFPGLSPPNHIIQSTQQQEEFSDIISEQTIAKILKVSSSFPYSESRNITILSKSIRFDLPDIEYINGKVILKAQEEFKEIQQPPNKKKNMKPKSRSSEASPNLAYNPFDPRLPFGQIPMPYGYPPTFGPPYNAPSNYHNSQGMHMYPPPEYYNLNVRPGYGQMPPAQYTGPPKHEKKLKNLNEDLVRIVEQNSKTNTPAKFFPDLPEDITSKINTGDVQKKRFSKKAVEYSRDRSKSEQFDGTMHGQK